MLRILNILTTVLIGLAATASFGLSEPFPASPEGTLFADEGLLSVQLDAPLKELFALTETNKTEKKVFVEGHLSYFTSGKKVTVPVRLRVKGHSTASFCPFKKLEIKFKAADIAKTIFSDMTSVDLHTHCAELGELDELEQHFNASYHNHREVLIYQMAKTLRIPTFQARAVSIRYVNTGLKADQAQRPYQAFFVEDTGDFLKRIHAREVKFSEFSKDGQVDATNQTEILREDLYRASLFNNLIRNPDWQFPCGDEGNRLWNLKVIETKPRHWVPLVYDFNLSPIVTIEKSYPMVSHCEFNLSDERKLAILASFKDQRAKLYQLLQTLKNDESAYDVLIECLDEFFGNI